MRVRLICSAFAALAIAIWAPGVLTLQGDEITPLVLQRFLDSSEPAPTQYRALRRLEARSEHFNKSAWMDVWTEADASGFRYEVTGQGGSEYIREKVFMPALETERTMWGAGARGAFTLENYTFQERAIDPAGLAPIGVKPRRKDVMLVNGAIFLRPETSDLVRVQGSLSKTPSFWTRRVEIVRHYERVAGVRLPVRVESVAHILVAGKATMTMTYQYETVNNLSVSSVAPSVAGQ